MTHTRIVRDMLKPQADLVFAGDTQEQSARTSMSDPSTGDVSGNRRINVRTAAVGVPRAVSLKVGSVSIPRMAG
jgi:hypothetical protein